MVRRTARACTNGITPITSRPATRNPMPVYMIDSIMTPPAPPLPSIVSRMPRADHALMPALRAGISPAGTGTCLAPPASLASSALRRPAHARDQSERMPGRRRRKFEIAHIGAEPHANARADRNHDDVIHGQRRHSQAADEVGGTVDAGEALINRIGGRQVIDQHHCARAFATEVEAD